MIYKIKIVCKDCQRVETHMDCDDEIHRSTPNELKEIVAPLATSVDDMMKIVVMINGHKGSIMELHKGYAIHRFFDGFISIWSK